MARRAALPALMVLAACTGLVQFFGSTFVSAPQHVQLQERVPTAVAGAAAGLMTMEPAYADMYKDEIFPIAFATSGAILWGIVLGFVLLRLQEAFPE
eukprot:CAMPEP_0197651204 /NCGR_PEP_ID=MMETSP1338-20131121/31434_1 /TAXON_ID=43686 ORGANISM="Pelagodinium beii, Strain RCC1491" /NCGR_SAMPLE_ID=MMETSP1338 /ASSEMBLY_ACC=CAM_ASM_000754 /LENGTH=96 /DNA_ID=CAMNT_0043225773 /DNA_START=67 /DNA_END=357 /DNA_ORIENTATION=-